MTPIKYCMTESGPFHCFQEISRLSNIFIRISCNSLGIKQKACPRSRSANVIRPISGTIVWLNQYSCPWIFNIGVSCLWSAVSHWETLLTPAFVLWSWTCGVKLRSDGNLNHSVSFRVIPSAIEIRFSRIMRIAGGAQITVQFVVKTNLLTLSCRQDFPADSE